MAIPISVSVLSSHVVEVRKEPVDRVWEWDRVGVEDDHVLGAKVRDVERFAQRPAFETLAAVPVENLESWPVLPTIQDQHRVVGRVIDHDHLVLRVIELRKRGEQTFDDTFLVVGRDMDRHERVVTQVDVIAVSVPVTDSVEARMLPDVAIAIAVGPVTAAATKCKG